MFTKIKRSVSKLKEVKVKIKEPCAIPLYLFCGLYLRKLVIIFLETLTFVNFCHLTFNV